MRRLYLFILLPALALALFLVEMLRRHGYAEANPPAWLPVLLVAAALPVLWLAYARFLTRFAAIDPDAALRLDMISYLPFLLLATYFLPAVRSVANAGTMVLLAASALCAAIKVAVLAHYRRAQLASVLSRPYLIPAAIVGLGLLLRVSLLAAGRFHGDEALYAHWGLEIATGRDIFLRTELVDKPPLLFYILALSFRLFGATETAARLPNLLASVAGIVILYEIARELYDRRTAALAALFLALSPFDIQFAPTAFTDPLMVALALAAVLLALRRRFLGAGLALGLAVITKPTSLFFLPLVILPAASLGKGRLRLSLGAVMPAGLGFAAVLALVAFWQVFARAGTGNFLHVGNVHYGGLRWVSPAEILPRLEGWLDLFRYLTGSPFLNALLLLGIPVLLVGDLWARRPGWLCDGVLVAFAAGFLAAHTVLSFGVWDRYLLGLAPVAALLLARIILLPAGLLATIRGRAWLGAAGAGLASLLLVAALAAPAQTALHYGFPVGSDHGAFEGIDDVAAYLKGNAPANAIVFHHWLGWHYSFYLFGSPLAFYYYDTPAYVLDVALRLPEVPMYVTFPSWTSADGLRGCLRGGQWGLQEVYRTYRGDGTMSFTVYRLQRGGG